MPKPKACNMDMVTYMHAHCMRTAYTLHVHCMCMCTACALHVHCMYRLDEDSEHVWVEALGDAADVLVQAPGKGWG